MWRSSLETIMYFRLLVLACVVCSCLGQFYRFSDDDRFENGFVRPYAWSDDLYDDRPFGFYPRVVQPAWGRRQVQSSVFQRRSVVPRTYYQPRFGKKPLNLVYIFNSVTYQFVFQSMYNSKISLIHVLCCLMWRFLQ